MINKKLVDFLKEETSLEDLGNQNLLHELPEFGKEVGTAINTGNLIGCTTELSSMLEDMDLYKASLLSNFIGFACEKEGDTSAGEGIIKLFTKSCTQVYEMLKDIETDGQCRLPDMEDADSMEELYREHKDWVRAYYGFETLCISTMAFLSRDAALRDLLKESGIADAVIYLTEDAPQSPYLKSIGYVFEMLNTCGRCKLLVLYPAMKKGFYASANDLNNCFHLLFLLEEQIYKQFSRDYGMDSFQAPASLISLAHGSYPEDCWDKSYSTRFMECNYRAAGHEAFGTGDELSLIWGEMPPTDIPKMDGYGVITLLEGGINRSFAAQFLAVPHSALNPYVEIERELEEAEYNVWMDKIRDI